VTYKSANGLGALPEIDAPTWANVVTQARAWQQPWDGDDPTEADMLQLSVGFDDRTPATYMGVRRLAVDVLVHHRGLQHLAAASVNVLLLLRKMTEPMNTWPALPLPATFAGQVATAVTGGTIPAGGSFAGGWMLADTTTSVRHPTGDLDAARPRSTTFEVDVPAAVSRGRYLLLAVCSSSTATATPTRLAGATLSDFLTTSSHSASRLLEISI
jgi:hypothetical protein